MQTIDDASDETQSWAQEPPALPCPDALPKGFTFENLPRRLDKSDFACTGPLPDPLPDRLPDLRPDRVGVGTKPDLDFQHAPPCTGQTPDSVPDSHRTLGGQKF